MRGRDALATAGETPALRNRLRVTPITDDPPDLRSPDRREPPCPSKPSSSRSHQERRADQLDHPQAARGVAARGLLQPLPASGRRRAHRPAHRFRHRRHVHAPVGWHHGRRRELRWQAAASITSAIRFRTSSATATSSRRTRAGPLNASCSASRARKATSFRTTRTSIPRAPTSNSSAPRPWTWSSPKAASPA